jgi:hypothetical protein
MELLEGFGGFKHEELLNEYDDVKILLRFVMETFMLCYLK